MGKINNGVLPGNIISKSSNGNSGQILYSNGSNSNAWASVDTLVSAYTHPNLDVDGTINVNGDLILNGSAINDRLDAIETLLHIPERNVRLENQYPELKQKWNNYNTELSKMFPKLEELSKLYSEDLEKYKNWESMKK